MIYDILGWASLAHLIAQFLEDQGWLKFKPFNCNLCLGFWVSLVPFCVDHGVYGFAAAGLAGVTSEAIYKILNRL